MGRCSLEKPAPWEIPYWDVYWKAETHSGVTNLQAITAGEAADWLINEARRISLCLVEIKVYRYLPKFVNLTEVPSTRPEDPELTLLFAKG